MNTERAIRKALEKHLLAMTGSLPLFVENGSYSPVDGVPYQRCAVIRAEPESVTQGRKLTKEHGFFQITLMYPEGDGTGDAEEYAGLVKQRFKPVQALETDGVTVQLTEAVHVVSGFASSGRWAIPISIHWMAYITG